MAKKAAKGHSWIDSIDSRPFRKSLATTRLFGDLSPEYSDEIVDDMIGAYEADAGHDYFDLVGMWIGGGPL